jgi:uncharacterized protein
MRFTQDNGSAMNLVRAYGAGEIKINDLVFRRPVIVSASEVTDGPELADASGLEAAHAAAILARKPELVLLGTGARQHFPRAEFGASFLSAQIGFEVMDTGAACRTFNVLVGEQRDVVALLFP